MFTDLNQGDFSPRTTCCIFGLDDILGAVVGIGSKIIGGASKNSSDAAARAQQQAELDKFTRLQGSEFDNREGAINDSTTRTNALNDEGFKAGLNQQRATNLENAGITTDFSGRSRAGQISGINQVSDIDAARNRAVNGSLVKTNAVTEAERARQQQFQGQSDDIVSALLPQIGKEGFDGTKSGALAMRGALVNRALSPSTINPVSNDPVVQAEMARQVGSGQALARLTAGDAADASSYGDAVTRGNQLVDRAAGNEAVIGNASDASFKALAPEQQAAQLEGTLATENADKRKQDVAANTASFLKLLSDEQNRTEKRVGDRQQGISQAISDLFTGGTQAEKDYINNYVNSSTNYEDALRQDTNFKINGTVATPSVLGTLANSVGDALLPKVSDLFKPKPKPTA